MSKSNKKDTEQCTLHSVIISLSLEQRIKMVYEAMKKNVNRRKEKGWAMTVKKKQMYELGFEDAVNWLLGNEL